MTNPHAETSEFQLRDARRDEAEAIAAVIRAAYAEYESSYTAGGWQRYSGMLGDVSSHFGKAEVIVANAGDVIAGSVMFYPNGAASGQSEWPEGWAGILRLAVHPEHRGLGIGRALTEECIRRCREGGIETLALHATAWMAVSRTMYECIGFVRDESFDFGTRSGELAMGYRLSMNHR